MFSRNATARFIGAAPGSKAGVGSSAWTRFARVFQQPMILAASSSGTSTPWDCICCIGAAICSSETTSTITL